MKTIRKSRIKPPTRAEQQCVFLAYSDVFEKNLHLRKKKAIHSLVLQHWSSHKNLVGGCGIHKVTHILQTLLKNNMFGSEAQASKVFSNLFPPSSQKDCSVKPGGASDIAIGTLERSTTLLERPIKTEYAGINNKPQYRGSGTLSNMPLDILFHGKSHRLVHIGDPTAGGIEAGRALLSLQSLRFPYETQHHILSAVQQLLEESCFNFVKQWLPSVLKKHNWNCAAAGELTEWLNILKSHARDLPNSRICAERQALFNKIVPAVARIRHTAVHRLHLTSEEFLDQISSARMLAEILQDVRSTSILQTLYRRVDVQSKKMEQNIKTMQQEVDTSLLHIQKQREALAQREQQVLSYATQQNIDIPVATSQALLASTNLLFASSKPDIMLAEQSIAGFDGNTVCTYGVIVEEDDIESDEDRLQVEIS